ncbi:MAG TPA: nucleotide exchange factor GrpE [Anaeromyxobacteraceae bacterium]|nr:nucleotide exchange factor GrpE [Anaeromyxobacteraceae bacterium]
MPQDDRPGISSDVLEDAFAEALAAVERRGGKGAAGGPAGESPPPEAPLPAAREPAPGEVERLRIELDMSQERARQVFAQLKDEHDRLLRTAADLENYKKRAARERDEVQRYGNERLVKEILPVLDNLDRALAAAPQEDPLRSGVEMTRRMLEDALGRFGVKGFSAKGQPFDPRVHEALMSVATADAAPGTVVEEQQRGFHLHERLIRPAAVVVAAAPPAPPAPAVEGQPGVTEAGGEVAGATGGAPGSDRS